MAAVAFDRENAEMVRRLLDGGPTSTQDDRGETALMEAAKYGRKDALALLLERVANPDVHDNQGRTAPP